MKPESKYLPSTKRESLIFRSARSMFRGARALLRPEVPTLRQVHRSNLELLVWANEDIGWRLLTIRRFEEEEREFLIEYLPVGGIFVDVGANVGVYTLSAARKVGEHGRVVAVEPLHRNALVIALAAELNGVQDRISIVEAPLAGEAGDQVSMSVPSGDGAYAHMERTPVDSATLYTTRTLDQVMEERHIEAVDIMKIDVEGAEYQVIRGAESLLTSQTAAPKIVMIEVIAEYLSRFGDSPADVLRFMTRCGYVANYLQHGQLRPVESLDVPEQHNIFFLRENSVQGKRLD
jgi:FkbM family methyltransferase